MSTRTAKAALVFVALLLTVPFCSAVDGVVLINQASSVNGLPGCAHSGFPIMICNSGSYRLSSNLVVSAYDTDAIQIFADNVSLDLNGFSIIGPWTSTSGHYDGSGIYSPNNNLKIINGTFTGFPQGIFLTGTPVFVQEVTVFGNNFGLLSDGSGFVDKVTATGNSDTGVFLANGILTHSLIMSNGFGAKLYGPVGYGSNTFFGNPNGDVVYGGTSMGNNVCTNTKC